MSEVRAPPGWELWTSLVSGLGLRWLARPLFLWNVSTVQRETGTLGMRAERKGAGRNPGEAEAARSGTPIGSRCVLSEHGGNRWIRTARAVVGDNREQKIRA